MTDPVPLGFDEVAAELEADLRGRVKSELDPDERLLWVGRPVRLPTRSGCFWYGVAVVVIALAVVLFALLGTAGIAPRERDMVQSAGVGALIVALLTAAGTTSGWLARRKATSEFAQRLYALTNRRAIVWLPARPRGAVRVVSIPRGKVRTVHRIEFPDGSGDVIFTTPGMAVETEMTLDTPYVVPAGFHGVADVRRVEEQVRRVLIVESA